MAAYVTMSNIDVTLFAGDFMDLIAAGAALGLLYLLVVIVVVVRFQRAQAAPAGWTPAVTVLKPLHGAEPALKGRLARLCRQDYPAPVQIVFGCQERSDPAIGAVESIRAEHPKAQIDLVIDPRDFGQNRKISNLVNMCSSARHQVVIASDSDIEVDSNYLARIVAPLEEDEVGAVTCLYHGVPDEGSPAWLSALAINAHFLPNVLVALKLHLAQPCFGSTVALRRDVLDRIGGFRAFADVLADDYAIGEAIRAAGYKLAIPNITLGHFCNERTISEFLSRQLRCARTIKSIDPFGHAGAFIGNPLPLALFAMLNAKADTVVLAGAILVCRIAICKLTERKFDLPPHPLWLVPATDLLLFGVYVCSFFGSTVTWRGRRYKVISDGTLSQDRS